jgi:YVTN family beta-propeller protein
LEKKKKRSIYSLSCLFDGVAVDPTTHKVYVANYDSNITSAIDGRTNKVTNVTVGGSPIAVAVDPTNGRVYVTNSLSNTVSVIDEKTNDPVIGVTFNVNPADSGQISCNKEQKEISTDIHFNLKIGNICKAEGNKGFVFNSWTEKFGSNSSRTITKAPDNGSFFSLFSNPNDNNYTSFNATAFGNFG